MKRSAAQRCASTLLGPIHVLYCIPSSPRTAVRLLRAFLFLSAPWPAVLVSGKWPRPGCQVTGWRVETGGLVSVARRSRGCIRRTGIRAMDRFDSTRRFDSTIRQFAKTDRQTDAPLLSTPSMLLMLCTVTRTSCRAAGCQH